MRAVTLSIVVAISSTAQAKYSFQGAVSLSAGWTNNAAAAPAGTPGAPVSSDFFFLINPGVVFTSALPRAVERVAYNFSANLYASHTELNSISNRLEWSSYFTPTPTTDLMVTAYATQSQLNTVSTLNVESGADAPTQVTRTGTTNYFGVGLSQSLVWSWSDVARLLESVGFLGFIPQSAIAGQTWAANASVGLERLFRKDSFAGILRMDYAWYEEQHGPVTNADGTVNPDGIVAPVQQQVIADLRFRWRRDFGHFWNTELNAGVLGVFAGKANIWSPAGGAAVRFLHPKVQVDLAYTHGAAPNALIQATVLSDNVALHATVPFGVRARLYFTAGGAYTHSQTLLSSGSLSDSFDVYTVDGTLAWAPLEGLAIFTRYSYLNQVAGTDQTAPIANLERHLVMLGLAGTYPTSAAAVVPSRRALRVDGSDMVGIPDMHSPPPQNP